MIYFVGNSDLIEEQDIYVNVTVEYCLDYFKDKKWIEVDTETEGLDCHSKRLLTLQLGNTSNQFVIDVRYIDILLFKELLETKHVILHNSKFDYKFFKKVGITLNHIYDTMLAECVIYCGYEKFGYGLKNLCLRYLDIDLDKTVRAEFFKLDGQPFTASQIRYAALDVSYLSLIKKKQEELIYKYDLKYCVDLENEVVKALADIEYNGMYLDAEEWLNNTQETQVDLNETQIKLDSIILTDTKLSPIYKPKVIQGNLFDFPERELSINYASNIQILKILKCLGFNIEDTNDRSLQKIKKNHIFVETLIKHRELSKVISTYGVGFLKYINKVTGRVHTSFWQVLNSGRVSSGSKFDNSPNLQNIPASEKEEFIDGKKFIKYPFRNCFKSRKGYLWVSIDYSGQELRLMADASDEEGFIGFLNTNRAPDGTPYDDLHCYVGTMLTGRTITKSDKKERSQAKNINFMKPYGGGPPKLADMANIPIEEAEEVFKKYAKAFPKLEIYLKNQASKAKKNMYSVTSDICKRRAWFPELRQAKDLRKEVEFIKRGSIEYKEIWKKILQIEGSVERAGMNYPIQGSAANVTKEALIEVRKLIQEYNNTYQEEVAYLICTVHDQIDVEVREDIAKEFAICMEKVMVDCGNKYVTKVKMTADTTVTTEWTK